MKIKAKINVSKIDKSKIFVGRQGAYLDITLLENKNGVDEYGNHFMVVQDVSKEDREAGIRGAILGNAKKLEPLGRGAPQQARQSAPPVAGDGPPKSDDVPF